jgi:hypothetical protein
MIVRNTVVGYNIDKSYIQGLEINFNKNNLIFLMIIYVKYFNQ